METLNTHALPLSLPAYTQLICQYDPDRRALWAYLNPSPRPCFTPTLLLEIRDLQTRLATKLSASEYSEQIRYLVYASATPEVFNLGGDVELFTRLIAARNRDALYTYGRSCTEAVFANTTNLGIDSLTTIALVQGTALGGGFEGALSCNVVLAEESAPLGFPEILFNLFPGMGAMNMIARKVGPTQAERLIMSGNILNGRRLWEMGVIDELAPDGEGMASVNTFIRRHNRHANGHLAMRRVRDRVCPVSYNELLDGVEIWVDAALRLTPRDLRIMNRIVTAQSRFSDQTAVFAPETVGRLEAVA